MSNNIRNQHVGKDRFEKEEYRKFLFQNNNNLDPTEKEKTTLDKTSQSKDDKEIEKKPQIDSTSLKYKIKDNGWVITIVGGLIVAVILGCVNFTVQQNINTHDISSTKENVDKLDDKIYGNDGLNIKVNNLDNQINGKNGVEERVDEIEETINNLDKKDTTQ
jgi:hypothetical protein